MVWREAPALADPFRGAQKRAVPPLHCACRRGQNAQRRLVCDFLGGERERRGLEYQKGYSVRFHPLLHVWPNASASLRRP